MMKIKYNNYFYYISKKKILTIKFNFIDMFSFYRCKYIINNIKFKKNNSSFKKNLCIC